MAIAYFIPDQHKLLTGGSSNSSSHNDSNNNNNNNSNATTSQSSSPSTTTTSASPTLQQQQQQSPPSNQGHSHFRANISIPISLSTSENNVGCWDLIAQIFCYALRFYHEARLSPAVLEISLEINNGTRVQPTATQQLPTATNAAENANTTMPPTSPSGHDSVMSAKKE